MESQLTKILKRSKEYIDTHFNLLKFQKYCHNRILIVRKIVYHYLINHSTNIKGTLFINNITKICLNKIYLTTLVCINKIKIVENIL